MNTVHVGLAQVAAPAGDSQGNRRRSVEAAGELFERGADIVVLPELCVPWYTADQTQLEAEAEPLEGPTSEAWHEVATAHNGLIVGGFCERASDGALYNSAVAVSTEGVIGHYRKLHLFDREQLSFTPGDLGLPTFATRFGQLGICVCYDLRFVEVVRALALSGAELICVPTAWIGGFDRQLNDWQLNDGELIPHALGALLQANLSQVFIACASQVGDCGDLNFLGSSILAGPYGEVVAGPLARHQDELALARVDLTEVSRAQVRGERIRPRADRRTDVYGVALGTQRL